MQDSGKKNFPFWLLTVAAFVILLLPELVRDGMFVDGVTYAAVSKNLANGSGSFWYPFYTKTLYPQFHEHPPLVFGIQSIFFSLFGSNNSIFPERIYTFLTAVITGILIVKFWRVVFKSNAQYSRLAWLPVLLWITIPLVSWSYKNNMLENTMGIFTLASVLCIYKGLTEKQFFFYLLSGSFFIFLAFLSKGFVALFPLGIVALYWATKKDISLGKMLSKTVLVFILFLLFFGVLILFIPNASDSLLKYFDIQVLKSLKGEREIPNASRIYILERLLNELIPAILLTVLVFGVVYKKRLQTLMLKNKYQKEVLFLVIVGFSASLPIIISPKQMGYYLVPSFPFFALAIGVFLAPAVNQFIIWIDINKKGFKLFKTSVFVLFLASLFFSVISFGKTGRDKETLKDIYAVGKLIPAGETVTLQNDMCSEWGLIAYFSRYFNISLDCGDERHTYQLVKKEGAVKFPESYETVPLELNNFVLLKEKK